MPAQQSDIIAPPRLTTDECLELNDWSEVVGFETDYQQVGRGKFEAWFDMSVGEDLRVVDQYCNREMTISAVPPDGFIPIIITQNGGAKGIFQGKELEKNEVAIMRPGFEGTYRTPPDLRLISLCFPESRLREAVETMEFGDFDALISGTRLVKLPPEIVRRLTSISRQVLDAPRNASGMAVDNIGVWQREIEDHFVTALITGLKDEGDDQPGSKSGSSGVRARRNRRRHLRVARDYIRTHLERPIGLETLARETGASPRTLEYAFREVFDTTPLRYLKTRRLHAARDRFISSDDPEMTVDEVARTYGFNHLSYFARDYHALFGEYPSETLRG